MGQMHPKSQVCHLFSAMGKNSPQQHTWGLLLCYIVNGPGGAEGCRNSPITYFQQLLDGVFIRAFEEKGYMAMYALRGINNNMDISFANQARIVHDEINLLN